MNDLKGMIDKLKADGEALAETNRELSRSLNDITPAEWDRAAENHRAVTRDALENMYGVKEEKQWEAATRAAMDINKTDDVLNRAAIISHHAAIDTQVGGSHYQQGGIEPIDFITSNQIPFCEANVIKYVFRHKLKNGITDLKKAKHYLEMLINQYEGL